VRHFFIGVRLVNGQRAIRNGYRISNTCPAIETNMTYESLPILCKTSQSWKLGGINWPLVVVFQPLIGQYIRRHSGNLVFTTF